MTPIGRLDFLCIDQVTDALVVVELKRGRPSDMVIGQIARYMGYVRSHLAMPGRPSRESSSRTKRTTRCGTPWRPFPACS